MQEITEITTIDELEREYRKGIGAVLPSRGRATIALPSKG